MSPPQNRTGKGKGAVPAPFFFAAAAFPLLVVYVIGLRRGLGTIDSGELSAVCHTLGISHPTGYPLYALVGRLWSLVPLGDPMTRMHLMSALFSAAACGFAALAVAETLRVARPSIRRSLLPISVVGAWAWGLSPSVWPQAVENEVYGLHFLFLASCLWLGIRWLAGTGSHRGRLSLFYVFGLGIAHHASLAFVVPSLLVALFARRGGGRGARLWLLPLGLLVLGLTTEIYLPLRSALEPMLDWGDPTSPARWFRHASGWQYRTWITAGWDFIGGRAGAHVLDLPTHLGWVLPACGLFGIIGLWTRRIPAAVFWLALFVTGLLWASAYDIKDIGPYYAPCDLAAVALGASGAAWMVSKLEDAAGTRWPGVAATVAVGLLVAVGAGLRWKDAAANGPPLADRYARSFLDSLPRDAILFSQQWDIVVSASCHLQLVEGLRRDVAVIDPELLRRSWYYPQLDRRWPGLLDPVREEVDDFLREVAAFEAGAPYDASVIEGAYQAVQRGLVGAYDGRRPIVSTPEVNPAIFGSRMNVPVGLVFLWGSSKGVDLSGRGPLPSIEPFLETGPGTDALLVQLMRRNIGHLALARSQMLRDRGDPTTAAALEEESRRLWQRAGGADALAPETAR